MVHEEGRIQDMYVSWIVLEVVISVSERERRLELGLLGGEAVNLNIPTIQIAR